MTTYTPDVAIRGLAMLATATIQKLKKKGVLTEQDVADIFNGVLTQAKGTPKAEIIASLIKDLVRPGVEPRG